MVITNTDIIHGIKLALSCRFSGLNIRTVKQISKFEIFKHIDSTQSSNNLSQI